MSRIHQLLVITAVPLALVAGNIVSAQAVAPLQIQRAAVAGTGTVDRADGDAHLTLTSQCNQVANRGRLVGTLQQRVGGTFVAYNFLFRRATCETTSSDLALRFQPESDIAFDEGPATVSLRLRVCSQRTGTCDRRRISREVVLAFP